MIGTSVGLMTEETTRRDLGRSDSARRALNRRQERTLVHADRHGYPLQALGTLGLPTRRRHLAT
jgi:hypothetical protein